MEYDFTAFERKLASLKSKSERLDYLHAQLYIVQKKLVDFRSYDKPTLKRLKAKTKADYTRYMDAMDKGDLIYWYNTKVDYEIAKKHSIVNVDLLKQRLRLHNEYKELRALKAHVKTLIERETNRSAKSATKQRNAPTYPAIGLFCALVNKTKLIQREPHETNAAAYCKRVCQHFGLDYADNVRQNFNELGTTKNKKQIKELILPTLDDTTRLLISKELSKT